MRNQYRLPWSLAAACSLLALTLTGCGGPADELNRQAVSGQVTLNNQPLDRGSISFDPQDRENGRSGGATIENGSFTLPKERGLPPGSYTVRVYSADTTAEAVTPDGLPGDSSKVAPERIPAAWNSNSQEQVTVEDGGENHFELSIP